MEQEQKFADFLPPLYSEALTVMADALLKIRYVASRPQTAESAKLIYEVSNVLHNVPDMLSGKAKVDEQYIRQQLDKCNKLIQE